MQSIDLFSTFGQTQLVYEKILRARTHVLHMCARVPKSYCPEQDNYRNGFR